jgi:hypothetical protein
MLPQLEARLEPLREARRSGAITAERYEAGRLEVLAGLGLIGPARCSSQGVPYACARTNRLPERLLDKLGRMPSSPCEGSMAAVIVSALMSPGERAVLLFVSRQGEIDTVAADPRSFEGHWVEWGGKPIPLDVSRIADIALWEPDLASPCGTFVRPTRRRLMRCLARDVDYACPRSNVLPPLAMVRVGAVTPDVPEQEVSGYGDTGLVSTLPVTLSLRSWTWPGLAYVTRRGEIVKLWSEADQSWWTEGDDAEIPLDVSMITVATPW